MTPIFNFIIRLRISWFSIWQNTMIFITSLFFFTYLYSLFQPYFVSKSIDIYFLIFPFVYGFFPMFKEKREIVCAYIPLSITSRFLVDSTFSFLSVSYIFICCFALSLFAFVDAFTLARLINVTIYILLAFFAERLIKTHTKRRKRIATSVLFGLGSVVCVSYLSIAHILNQLSLIVTSLISLILIIVFNYRAEAKLFFKREPVNKKNTFTLPAPLQYIISNKLLLISLGLAFFLKISFMVLYFLKATDSKEFHDFLWLFSLPVAIFTYVFDNLWGYCRSLILAIECFDARSKTIVSYYLRLLLYPLITDVIVTFTWFTAQGLLSTTFSIFYISTLILLITVGLWTSLFLGKPVSNPMSLTSITINTSPVVSISLIIIIFIMLGLNSAQMFDYLCFSLIGVSILSLLILPKIYSLKNQSIYERI